MSGLIGFALALLALPATAQNLTQPLTAEEVAFNERQLDRLLKRMNAAKERYWPYRIEAEELWARLKRHSAADRRVLVEDGQDYQSWALCEKVAAESLAAAASDPREAFGLAELAVHIAERIPDEAAWRRRVEELLDPAVVARIEAG